MLKLRLLAWKAKEIEPPAAIPAPALAALPHFRLRFMKRRGRGRGPKAQRLVPRALPGGRRRQRRVRHWRGIHLGRRIWRQLRRARLRLRLCPCFGHFFWGWCSAGLFKGCRRHCFIFGRFGRRWRRFIDGLLGLLSYLKVAIFEPQLRNWTSRTTFVVKSCDFRAPATKVDFAYYFRTEKSRFSSPSCESGLCVLLSYLKVAIFKPRLRKWTLRTTFVLKSCDFQAQLRKLTSRTTFVLKSCDFRAPAAKVDLAKMLRLPPNLCLALLKCCACHKICT